jgi:hypothetical protein
MFQSAVYFIPVYLFGILSSIHKEKIYNRLRGREIPLISIVDALAVIRAVFFQGPGHFSQRPFPHRHHRRHADPEDGHDLVYYGVFDSVQAESHSGCGKTPKSRMIIGW